MIINHHYKLSINPHRAVGVLFLEREDLKKRGLFITWITKNNFDDEKNVKERALRTEDLINFPKSLALGAEVVIENLQ